MIDKVRKTIQKYDMLREGDTVTVGLSGGADSVCLAYILLRLKDEIGFDLRAAHINHGIRGAEADRDESFVRDFCEKNGIELTVFHRSIPLEAEASGESEEECGRRIRYECFASLGGKTATAHNLSDSIETTVFNIIRGSSLKGVCGIPAVRGNIVRPLIECSSEEIRSFCRDNGISYVVDSTNLETQYTRNYIRREILPRFEKINPGYAGAITRLQASARRDSSYLEKTAEEFLGQAETERGLSCVQLKSADKAVAGRALVAFIREKSGLGAEYRHIGFISDNLGRDFEMQLDGRHFVRSKNGYITVTEKAGEEAGKFCVKLQIGENETPMGKIEISVCDREKIIFNKKNTGNVFLCNIDYDKIDGNTAVIRSRNEGDEITLAKRGVTKSLKKLYNELKIPKSARNSVPVIADGEKVIWVYGAGYNKKCEITEKTKKIMTIKAEDDYA
ncbi:MAG: tRNA lysidine(34) synthetase TilS [Acutalibacteraceae bacterium]|nr:tRNA lysidine(34) synthetase TilS [Oscillospiraceae bacterium]